MIPYRIFTRILLPLLLIAGLSTLSAQTPDKIFVSHSQASIGFSNFIAAAMQDPADAVCPRFPSGSLVADPPELTSQNGVLEVTFKFMTAIDAQGLTRYCYITDMGLQAPTLRVNPGDKLVIHLQNDLPASRTVSDNPVTSADCSAQAMDASSTNLHFHGLNIAPVCHQDEVIHTAVQSQQTFDYIVQIPADEPPGLYWYHPEFSEAQVLGGASGTIIVEGIQNFNTSLAGLPERVFVLRDQATASTTTNSSLSKDISLNYVPVTSPANTPAAIQTAPSEQELWRVLNASADTLLHLQVLINNVPQSLKIVAVDGVPQKDASGNPNAVTQIDYVLAPGSRVEFVLTTPAAGQRAQLVTQKWNNGPQGDILPARTIATVEPSATSTTTAHIKQLPAITYQQPLTRFAALDNTSPATQRKLYFSQNSDASQFYLTVDGQSPKVFDKNAPPSIVVRNGAVEQWTIENRSESDHTFHIHQTHFQTLAVNGQPVTDTTLRDTIDVPHWSGNASDPFPSVTLLMDFRDPDIVGTFVYQCHVLSHADRGMMGAVQVLPAATASTATTLTASTTNPVLGQTVTFTAAVTASNSAIPAGSVTFYDGTTVLGTATLDSSGVASYATKALSLGTHSITVAYAGNASFAGSTSSAVKVTVAPATTTTTLTASPASAVLGQTVIFTATVTGYNSAVPSEPVTFLDGTTVVGTAISNSSGVAVFKIKSLSLGTHWIHASYPGNTWYASSTSYAVKVTVAPASTTTTLAVSNTNPVLGQTITFTATVTGFNSAVDPKPVTFYDGTRVVATAMLNASGVATFSTKSFGLGTYWIHAFYPGDTWFAASSSWAIKITVSPATTTTKLAASATTLAPGQSVTFTATVIGFNSAVDVEPVTFYDGTTVLGTASLGAPSSNGSRTALYTTTALSAGTHSITASYPGNTWFASSTSSAVAVTVTGAPVSTDFTLDVNPATLTVVQGQSATADLTLTPANGFNSPVSFSCSGLPEGAQCSFSPQTITPDGTNAASSKLTITTTQSRAMLQRQQSLPRAFYAFLLPGLGIMFGFIRQRKKLYANGRALCLLLVLLAITTCLTACGITVNPNPPGVSSTITITASPSTGSSALSHAAKLTLTVKP